MTVENGGGRPRTTPPPYIAYRTFRTFTESLRQGLPGRIDRSLMGSISGSAQSALLQTLQFLRLTTEHGTPTDNLARLVNSEGADRQKTFREILLAAYASLFEPNFDLQNTTFSHFDEQFKRANITGDTIRKCEAFFLAAAKDAGLPLSRFLASGRPAGNRTVRQPRRQAGRRGSGSGGGGAASEQPPPVEAPPQVSWEQLLLAKFPSFDPSWDSEVQSKWFDAFDKLMRQKPGDDERELPSGTRTAEKNYEERGP